jgi:hypothetical protein
MSNQNKYRYKTSSGQCQENARPETLYSEYKTPVKKVEPVVVPVPITTMPDTVPKPTEKNLEQQTCKGSSCNSDTDSKSNVNLNLKWTTNTYSSTADPNVWGPSFWFSLHNGASKYPENATEIFKDHMKNFILGLPVILPCEACRGHAREYIDNRYNELDEICRSRKNLFNFFVDFHNMVNERNGKGKLTYDEALRLYSGEVKVSKMNY